MFSDECSASAVGLRFDFHRPEEPPEGFRSNRVFGRGVVSFGRCILGKSKRTHFTIQQRTGGDGAVGLAFGGGHERTRSVDCAAETFAASSTPFMVDFITKAERAQTIQHAFRLAGGGSSR